MSDFVLRGGTVVFPDRAPALQDILVQGGKIAAVLSPGAPVPTGTPEQSAAGLHVFPGLIDAHVHFGFGEKITEYTHETVYAAQGGIATVLGYFLNNEAYADVYKREQEYARTRCHVDYGFHFSTANELHIKELGAYIEDYGVTSFKYFMNFKGEEGRYLGLDGTDDGFFWDLLGESARVGKPIVVCHTENIEIVNRTRQKVQAAGGTTLKDWAACKPAVTESEPAIRAMYFAERAGARVYFPHISSRLALDEVRRWRKRYDQVWIETCPHYLTHTEDSELGGIGKANPPFRSKDDQDALWEAVFDGTIDLVASDHSARRRVTKDKPLWLAAQGFPGHRGDPAGPALRGPSQAEAAAAADLPAARVGAGEDLRPRAGQGQHRAGLRRRLHGGRPEQGTQVRAGGDGLVRRLQPLREPGPQRLAGAHDRARRDGDGRRQDRRPRRSRQVPLAPHRPGRRSSAS